MKTAFTTAHGTQPHPFRRLVVDTSTIRPLRNEDHDLKLFVLSFTAFFIAISTFIL